jgi:hypothetical protein
MEQKAKDDQVMTANKIVKMEAMLTELLEDSKKRARADEEKESRRNVKRLQIENHNITAVALAMRYFHWRELAVMKAYAVCKVFYRAFRSDTLWQYYLASHYGVHAGDVYRWRIPGITLPCWGATFGTAMKKYRYIMDLQRDWSISALIQKELHKCNAYRCVVIDPTLGMENSHVHLGQFNRDVIASATLLYSQIVYKDENGHILERPEAKCVFVSSYVAKVGRKKPRWNPVFSGMMSFLETCSKRVGLSPPLKINGNFMAGYTGAIPERNNKENDNDYAERLRNFKQGVRDVVQTDAVNRFGYVVLTPESHVEGPKIDSFFLPTMVHRGPHKGKAKTGSKNLWVAGKEEWDKDRARYLVAIKHKINVNDTNKWSDTGIFLEDMLRIDDKRARWYPYPLTVQELTLDLQCIGAVCHLSPL